MRAPDHMPSWATPAAWEESEQLVNRAEANYRELAERMNLEETAFGKFIVVSSENSEHYVIGDCEADADEKWQAKYGDNDDAALFQIGNI